MSLTEDNRLSDFLFQSWPHNARGGNLPRLEGNNAARLPIRRWSYNATLSPLNADTKEAIKDGVLFAKMDSHRGEVNRHNSLHRP
jgi:hypothetical protein